MTQTLWHSQNDWNFLMSPHREEQKFLRGRKVEIPEDRYKADFELLSRYTSFSSEILRLSLAGLAVVGFFLTVTNTLSGTLQGNITAKWFMLVAIVLLGASAAFSLIHSFLAADGMFHHLRAIKLLILIEQEDALEDEQEDMPAEVKKDEEQRNQRFKWSAYSLFIACTVLIFAATFLVLALAVVMFAEPR